MSKIDSITLEINTDVDMDKLERIKNLLDEIKTLHDGVFGNGEVQEMTDEQFETIIRHIRSVGTAIGIFGGLIAGLLLSITIKI